MANPGDRLEIELALRYPTELIVCGEAAKNNRAVKWYRWKKNLTILASALTGIGVVSPILNAIQDKEVKLDNILKDFFGLPLVFLVAGIVVIAVIAIAQKWYEANEVEKKAILALALSESYGRLKTDLESKLPYPDPRFQLVSIREAA